MMKGLALILGLAAPASTPSPPARPPAPVLTAPWLGLTRGERDDPKLEPTEDGGYRYLDPKRAIDARIAADGSVDFAPSPRVRGSGTGTRQEASAWFDGFVDALQRPAGKRDRPDLQDVARNADGRTITMPDRDDLSRRAFATVETVNWGPYGPPPIMVSTGASFGPRITSTAARSDFMRRTEPMRRDMAARNTARNLERAAQTMTARVREIWEDPSRSASARKAMIFELWADANPHAVVEDDALAVKTAESARDARRAIEVAVRRLLPRGSTHAYTDAELSRLNAGRPSTDRFVPYPAR